MRDNLITGISRFVMAGLTVGAAAGALAGTYIDTNLPTGTIIVNIDAKNDGAADFNQAQTLWYQPFGLNTPLNSFFLTAGKWSFTIINQTDAATEFPLLTPSQLAEIGGAWTFNSPWSTSYIAFDSSALSKPLEPQVFSGGLYPQTYNNAADAYDATKAAGMLSTITTGPLGRVSPIQNPYFDVPTGGETLLFVIPDYYLPDNNGIESIVIHPYATPEPAPIAAMGCALLGLAIRKRRNR